MTDTGLTTANLSTLTAWQQVILYLQMILGDTTIVSWIMVLVRKEYFRTECENLVSTNRELLNPEKHREALLRSIGNPVPPDNLVIKDPMLHRGVSHKSTAPNVHITGPTPGGTLIEQHMNKQDQKPEPSEEHYLEDNRTFSSSPRAISIELPTSPTHEVPTSPTSILRERRVLTFNGNMPIPERGMTILSSRQNDPTPASRKYGQFGGFPGPLEIIASIFKRIAPSKYGKLQRTMTIPHSTTLEEKFSIQTNAGVPIGRNSNFHTEEMTDEQLIKVGGIEYRALKVLSYGLPIYFVATQLIAYILFAPWLSSTDRYDDVFEAQPRLVKKPWYSLFLVTSAYTGTGLTLADMSMVPFQEAYLMIFGVLFLLLAGNHAQPVFLRFMIWVASRFTTEGSEADNTLSFLLHHPRRCFLYLFPSHQTWFLFIVLIVLSCIEWLSFGVLNIGLEVFRSLPMAPRVIIGLFQGIAVRASGLTIIPIGSLAPALQFLYVVLMYIGVYPVAMCIRATNVYEEKSLGIFEVPEGDITEDLDKLEVRERVGKYLGWHIRQQISIDIWWLVWAIFIVAIVERGNIMDSSKEWFNMFAVIFELVSAFGGIGLSLGLPYDNYSFTGSMHTLSKLVIIVIMVRGRHRGLPLAVDRAILQPERFSNAERSKSVPHTAQDPTRQSFNLDARQGV